MHQPTASPNRSSRWLNKPVAAGIAAALVIGSIAGSTALSASAAETLAWNSPFLTGAPVLPGAPVTLGDGTIVYEDYNIWGATGNIERDTHYAPTFGALLDIQVPSNADLLLAKTRNGAVVRSEAGGATGSWIDLNAPSANDLSASADGQTVALAGRYEFYLSTDGGDTWPIASGLPGGYVWQSASVSADGNTVVAVGEFTDDMIGPDGEFVNAPDSGVWVWTSATSTWRKSSVSPDVDRVSNTNRSSTVVSADGSVIAFLTSTTAFGPTDVVTGTIEKSTDGGTTWLSQPAPAGAPFNDMAMSGNGQKIVITRGVVADFRQGLGSREGTVADNQATFASEDTADTWREVLNPRTGQSQGFADVAVPANGVDPGTNTQALFSPYVEDEWFLGGTSVAVSSAGTTSWSVGFDYLGLAALGKLEMARVQSTHRDAVAPLVKSITPDRGPTSGGQEVTVIGDGFDTCSVVSIDGSRATTAFVDASHLTFVTPESYYLEENEYEVVGVNVLSDCGGQPTNTVDYTYVGSADGEPPVTTNPPADSPVGIPVEPSATTAPPVVTDPPVVVDPPVVTDPPVVVDPPVVTDPPSVAPPAVTPPTGVTPPVQVVHPGLPPAKPFEAQTSAETAPNPASGLSLLMVLAGLAAVGQAFARRRKEVVS